MADRMREVVGKHSTWYQCDEHDWDFTNEDGDVCPVCKGEAIAEERIIKLLEDFDKENASCQCCFTELCVNDVIALIKGEK